MRRRQTAREPVSCQGHRQRFFNALAAMQQERCVRQYDEMDSGKTKQGLEHRRQISPNEQDLNSHHIAPASCWPTGLPPGVKIVVAFNSSMANCPAASFHDQNTAFLLLSRIQRAGTAQSQTSRYTFRYQHCRRAQHVRRHAQEVAAKSKQENRHGSPPGARCDCCTKRSSVCRVARTAFDGAGVGI